MDVLNAELFPVEDRVYRVIKVKSSYNYVEDNSNPRTIPIEDDDEYDPDLPILHQGNTFYISFHVPKTLIRHIIGSQNRIRKIIEQNGVKLNVPERESKKEDITISGFTLKVVSDAYHKVMDRINTARLRMDFTHFISLPVNSSNIQESFIQFKKTVLDKYRTVRGIHESIFEKPENLHITVVMLVLLDENDNQKAIAIVTKCLDDIFCRKEISEKEYREKEFPVHVKGIEYMNDDPAEVDVLYAKVEELHGDNRLQLIADKIYEEFSDENLSKKQNDRVKLHVTLMNTRYRRGSEIESDNDNAESNRVTFDARQLVKDFADFEFGQLTISEIHISVRYATGPDGYYRALHKIKLSS